MKRVLAFFFFVLFSIVTHAQASSKDEPVQMAGVMRENGKIYVVVAVVVTILIGLFIYLISVDRKLSKLEKKEKL